jgi:hypothetical protein
MECGGYQGLRVYVLQTLSNPPDIDQTILAVDKLLAHHDAAIHQEVVIQNGLVDSISLKNSYSAASSLILLKSPSCP